MLCAVGDRIILEKHGYCCNEYPATVVSVISESDNPENRLGMAERVKVDGYPYLTILDISVKYRRMTLSDDLKYPNIGDVVLHNELGYGVIKNISYVVDGIYVYCIAVEGKRYRNVPRSAFNILHGLYVYRFV